MKKSVIMALLLILGAFGALIFSNIKSNSNTEMISPIGNSFNINTLGTTDEKKEYTVYGYFPYWTVSEAENFRLDLLTDVSYFGLEINSKGDIVKTKVNSEGEETNHSGYWVWKNEPVLNNFIIKSKNLGIRNSISVISHIDSVSTEFLECNPCWDIFYTNIKEEMEGRNIKDINLNFEYYELVPEEIALKFTEFTEFLKKKMRKDFPGGEIVVTAFADSVINQRITHIPSISKVADKIFIMAYDFHVTPNGQAAPVSPLGGAEVHAGYDIRTMIKDYLAFVPPQKLILGVPYYGFNWGEDVKTEDLEDDKEEEEKAEESKDEEREKLVRTSITQTYAQIMEKAENDEIKVIWDELGQVPYYEYINPSTETTRKVYFENEKSLRIKYRIAKEFNLAGIGIWALGYDENRPELWKAIEEEF